MPSRLGLPESPLGSIPAKPAITSMAILGAVSVTIMLAGQIVVGVLAFVWAASGLLHLNLMTTEIVAAVVAIPALWACWRVAVLAWQAETDPENN